MDPVAHYMRIHLAGAAAGIDLFGHSGRAQRDPEIGEIVLEIRQQLTQERRQLTEMADRLHCGESIIATLGARALAGLSRLKPNGGLLKRTPMDDLLEMEAMRDAVAGKAAGWQALLGVAERYDGLNRRELELLLDQAEQQHARLTDAHSLLAARALQPSA